MELVLDRLGLRAGEFQLRELSMTVPSGKCGVLMGRTGEGKTSVLEAVCGLRQIEAGSIRLDGRDLAGVVPGERGIGLVPQDTVLFPHLTVWEHLAFAPRLRAERANSLDLRCRELASNLRIDQLVGRRPAGLSGGEAKRVALGRALAAEPALLCLDEPFAGLDDATQGVVEQVIEDYRARSGATLLLVTHHREEVGGMEDLAWELSGGCLKSVPGDSQPPNATKQP